MKALKNKIPAEQYAEMYDIKIEKRDKGNGKLQAKPEVKPQGKPEKSSRKEKQEVKQPADEKPTDEDDKKEKVITDKQKGYGKILDDISGSLKAVLFDKEDKELKKIPVRELTDSLKKSNNISTVVFDGIITQRLLDIANSKNIKEIVGIKLGNVVKMPASVKVLTKKDLE